VDRLEATEQGRRRVRLLMRVTSAVWLVVISGLGLSVTGSQLLSFAQPGRYLLAGATVAAAVAMLARIAAPDRAGATRWGLLLIGFVSISAFLLALFASELSVVGFTVARVGYAILLLTPALFSYLHWIGERVVRQL